MGNFGAFLSVLLIGMAQSSWGQCNNGTAFSTNAAPAPGNSVTLTTCQYAGEYATVTGVAASAPYQSTSSVATDFITVRRGTSGGALIASGVQPLNWTSTTAGTYYIHCNTNAACGTQSVCRTTTLTATSPMAYASSTTTQINTTAATKCSLPGKEIIGVQVVTTGITSPLSVTRFTLRTNGSTAPLTDIAAINIYYTGNSATFATTNPFGTAAPAASGTNILINGTRALATGVNHFWVTYDLNAAAATGNVLDAQCTSLIVATVTRTPSVTSPAGTRTVTACPPSPGGVDPGLLVWLRSDAGLTTSGVNVTAWADQSPAATTTTVNGSPDRVLAGRNYNPTVLFTMSNAAAGGGDFLKTANLNVRSVFCAAQLQNTARESTHIVTYDGVSTSLPCSGCAIHGGSNGANVAEFGESGYGNAQFQAAGVWRRNGDAAGVANTTRHSGNFDLVTALGTGTGSVNALLGGQLDITGFFNGRLRDWLGPVGELVLYSGPVTTVEANRVESYLAIKYGITLGGNGSTTLAYRSSAGTTLWAANSGYHYDVIGIGRDDKSALVQKQSKTPDDTTRIYLNTLTTTNQLNTGSFTNDGAFVMVGRNSGKVCATLASSLEMPAGLYSRLEREWKVVNTSFAGTFNFAVKLNGCAAPGSVNPADLRLLVDNDGNFSNATVYAAGAGLAFTYTGGIISVTGISTAMIPQNGTRYITIASVNSATPLPIELVAFDAECDGNNVALSWTTASERNNSYFTVERSEDGMDYQALAHVDGIGTSSAMHHYAWTDEAPAPGVAYYRLKQTDFDGTRTWSHVVAVNCRIEEDFIIFPNPASDGFSFHYSSRSGDAPLDVELHTITGQLVWQKTYTGSTSGTARVDVGLEGVSEGVYFVRFTQGSINKTFKLSVLK